MSNHLGVALLWAAASVAGTQAASALEVRLGHQLPVTHDLHGGAEEFVRLADELSGGEISVLIFPAGQLGDERSQTDQVRLGSLNIFLGTYGGLGNYIPRVSVLDAPYAVRDLEHWYQVEGSPIFEELSQAIIDELGIRILSSFYYGSRHLVTSGFSVDTPADLENRKIRIPEAPVYIEMIRAMGGSPTPFSYQEVYLGMQQGILDGAENPLGALYTMKFYEVADNISLTAHMSQFGPLLINDAFFSGLTEEQQSILLEAARRAAVHVNAIVSDGEAAMIAAFEEQGVTVRTPDVEAFRAQVFETLPPVFEEDWGAGTYAAIQALGR